MDRDKVANVVIRRLPKYYRVLEDLKQKGVTRISSGKLSELTCFSASQIRQDLNNFGGFGQQGYGYRVEELHKQIEGIIGIDRKINMVITGIGNLGQAIAKYSGFRDINFNIIGLFDRNPNKIDMEIQGVKIRPIEELSEFINKNKVEIGVITTHKDDARRIADIYSQCGIKGIWNFASIDLEVPEEIIVENVNLNESLCSLAYYLKEKK